MTARSRTAPESWGYWPPQQERITAVIERAARKLLPDVERLNLAPAVILLAKPKTPGELDCFFPPGTNEVCAGYILALNHHRKWLVYWEPERDAGYVSQAIADWGA